MKFSSIKTIAIAFAGLAVVLLAVGYGLRAARPAGFARMERGWMARFGTATPNRLFSSRITNGMTAQEVMQVVPPPDKTQFLLLPNGNVVQRLDYAIPSTWDYEVYVLYRSGRVSNLEFDDAYIDSPRSISESEAHRRLREQASPPLP